MTTHLYIIRGVPGSGKTTLAKKLFRHGIVAAHFEADMFMCDNNGNYLFDPTLLKFCHKQCQASVDAALTIGQTVAVSNTFVRKWEMEPYLYMAEKHNAQVTVIVCQGEYKNTHNVPSNKVEEMKRRFEY
jgi:predicted kinase